MDGKITYTKEGYIPLLVPDGEIVKAKEGQIVSPGMLLAKSKIKSMLEVNINGKVRVKIGDKVKAGDILFEKGIVRKSVYRSEIDAKVINIENKIMYLEDLDTRTDNENSDLMNPFKVEVKIHKIYENVIYLKSQGMYVNFLVSKGRNIVGNMLYISADQFNLKSLSGLNLKDKIVVIDYLPSEVYPRLAALNVLGVITNTLDYAFFKNIILLSVPIAVYSGFGNSPFDKKTASIFKSLDNNSSYFDVDYNRLFVPMNKTPNLKGYEFESMSFK